MQVLRAEPYLELSSGQSAHCYQLFVEKDPKIEIPTVQVLRLHVSQSLYCWLIVCAILGIKEY
jgi:hypothetical protein